MELLRQHACPHSLEPRVGQFVTLSALDLPPGATRLTQDYVRAPIFDHPSAYCGDKDNEAYILDLIISSLAPSDADFDWFKITDREPWKRTMVNLPGLPSYRDFIFRRPEYSPGLPLIPGRPGTVLAPRSKRLIEFGKSASIVVLIKPELSSPVSSCDERWRYMGEYLQHGPSRPLSVDEWRNLPQSVCNVLAYTRVMP